MTPTSGYPGILLRQHIAGAFSQWDLSDCGPKIEDSKELWYIKDDVLTADDIGDGPWALRLEVDFSVPGDEDETVLTSPIYSKY